MRFADARWCGYSCVRKLGVAVAALALTGPAWGQAADADTAADAAGVTTLSAVTVKGQSDQGANVPKAATAASKTDTPLIETPQSVSVVTREQLDQQNVQTLSQALAYTAGVSTNGTGTDGRYDWPQIRGFSASTYGLYLDGLRWMPNQFAGRFDPYGLEQVQVLKGPASVLYGQSTPGGLIDMVSKMPTTDALHDVQVDYGSYDRRQLKADFGGAIDGHGEDAHWLYRFTALGHDDNTQVNHTGDKRLFLAPALTWKPDSTTRLTILGNFQRDILGAFYPFLPAQGTVLPNPNGKVPTGAFYGDTDFNAYSRVQSALGYQFEKRIGEVWTLRQNFRFNRFRVDNWEQEYGARLENDLRTLDRYAFAAQGDTRGYAVDNQAQAHFTLGRVEQTVLAGIDYGWQKLVNGQLSNYTSTPSIDLFEPVYNQPVPALTPTTNSSQHASQAGLYLQDQVKFDRKWVLLLGGREDYANTATHNWIAGAESHQDDHKFSGRVGAVYLSDIGLAPYVSYSESFLPSVGTDFSGAQLKPTTGKQVEGGVKYQPPGLNSFVTLSAYDIRQRNVQESDPNHPGFAIQTGEIRSRGVELEGVASLARGLDLRLAYTADPVHTVDSVNPSALGARPTVTPEHMASLWMDYDVPRGPFAGLGAGAGVRYVGNTYGGTYTVGTSQVPFTVPSYTLVDAVLHYQWHQLGFAINATNLLDRSYVEGCYGGTVCSYGNRRNIIGSMRYSW